MTTKYHHCTRCGPTTHYKTTRRLLMGFVDVWRCMTCGKDEGWEEPK